MIRQPLDVFVASTNARVSLVWSSDFNTRWQARFNEADDKLARTVLKLSEPYIPKDSGYLIASGKAERGLVVWTAKYARRQYYLPNRRKGNAGLRGSLWFERMMQVQRKRVVSSAKEAFKK